MKHLLVATSNLGKLREIAAILSGLSVTLTSLRDHWDPVPVIPEEGETFLENAHAKATWVRERVGEMWVLADDSGLEVDFLSGAPGVRSARYAGPEATDRDNNGKLLESLSNCPDAKRTARFRCVMVLLMPGRDSLVAEGCCEGSIGHVPRGEHGFGYDPLFTPVGFDRSFAELDEATKNTISHRARALTALRERILQAG